MNLLIYIIGGTALGLAWLLPGTIESSILGFISVVALIFPSKINDKQHYLGSFLYGVISHSIAFYWLRGTIQDFGGYGSSGTFFLQALFVLISALDFPFFILIARNLKFKVLDKFSLKNLLAWLAISVPAMRLFPWDFAHTFSGFTLFTQAADIGGVFLVTAIIFILAEGLVKFITKEIKLAQTAPYFLLLLVNLSYGFFQTRHFNNLTDKPIKVSLIQADISVFEKNNVKYLEANTEKYWELSKEVHKTYQPDLIIWPESAITSFISEDISNTQQASLLPYLPKTNFLVGSLSTDGYRRFNSAFGVDSSGKVTPPYHKQILMPFGEFMPFADRFPKLKDLNPNVAEFTAGKKVIISNLGNISAAPLICYEDLLPKITHSAVQKGANILVNLTNDAWFGKSVAPAQHNQIASFRAIESRRYLLRSTNSGLTSIISPTGKTMATIPVFESGTLNQEVHLINHKTIYSQTGDFLWWILCYFAIISSSIFIFLDWRKSRKTPSRS